MLQPKITLALIFINLFANSNAYTQELFGRPISGYNAGEKFGKVLAMSKDGNTVASGTEIKRDPYNKKDGQVRFFKKSGSSFKFQKTAILDYRGASEKTYSLLLNETGTLAAISYPKESYVTIVKYNNSEWQKIAKIKGKAYGSFGKSVAFAKGGDLLFISSQKKINEKHDGVVRIYAWDGMNYIKKADSLYGFKNFGHNISVSRDGTTLAINSEAQIHIFELVKDGYQLIATLSEVNDTDFVLPDQDINLRRRIRIGNETNPAGFGNVFELSANGKVLITSAPFFTENHIGKVCVFEKSNSKWIARKNLYGSKNAEYFGEAISINQDGSRISVASPYASSESKINCGKIETYDFVNDSWELNEIIYGENEDDYLGKNLILSDDGKILSTSSEYVDISGNNSGALFIYKLN
jgi:hypothetical protein